MFLEVFYEIVDFFVLDWKFLGKTKTPQSCWNFKKLFQTPKVTQKLRGTIGTGLTVADLY